MGGLTFYALVVIPTTEHVLGNHRDVGFITQQVTIWLNLSASVPILVLLWNLIADRAFTRGRLRYGLVGTWIMMVVSQIALFVAHAWMTRILDLPKHSIREFDTFELRHNIYEGIVTVQWVAALLHLWLALMVWRIRDRSKLNPVPTTGGLLRSSR